MTSISGYRSSDDDVVEIKCNLSSNHRQKRPRTPEGEQAGESVQTVSSAVFGEGQQAQAQQPAGKRKNRKISKEFDGSPSSSSTSSSSSSSSSSNWPIEKIIEVSGDYFDVDYVDRKDCPYSRYTGKLDGNKAPHGKGIMSYKNNFIFDGTFNHGKKQSGDLINHDIFGEKAKFTGDYDDNEKPISGTQKLRNGSTYEGQVDESYRPHGEGVLILKNGTIITGTFDHGSAVDIQYEYTDGRIYYGALNKKWQPHHQNAAMTFPKESAYSSFRGNFENGQGKGTLFFKNGGYFKGKLPQVPGLYQGKGILKESLKGWQKTGNFVNGQLEEHAVVECHDGLKWEGPFLNGLKHGIFVTTHIDGLTYQQQYDKDMLVRGSYKLIKEANH